MANIDFEPLGKRVPVPDGGTIFVAAHEAGVTLGTCGGLGTCGTCRVRVCEGPVSPLTESEREALTADEIAQGWRLACFARPLGDVKVELPASCCSFRQRLQLAGRDRDIEVDPIVAGYEVSATAPTIDAPLSDQSALAAALAERYGVIPEAWDIAAQRQLAGVLRQDDRPANLALRGNEVIAADSGGARWLGLAYDLGTTKIAAYLTDLETGEVLGAAALLNGQIPHGEDVMSRLSHAMTGGATILRDAVLADLNALAVRVCEEHGRPTTSVAEVTLVGNTAMHHLFLGLPVRQLALAPYVPTVSEAVDVKARDLGLLVAPGAYVHCPPVIAGFVGSDHVAMLLATALPDAGGNVLGLDIGTNTEMSLVSRGHVISCSCASGPAFEGAHIRDGMRAAAGAVERVEIADGRAIVSTIDGAPPVGLCGSGILDAVAALRRTGLLSATGRLAESCPPGPGGRGRQFVIVPAADSGSGRDIVLTEEDIQELLLAKGAIASGAGILLAEAGISAADLDEVIVAGAFGTFIDVGSARDIGMFPALPLERFSQVGNAAGVGARMALISGRERRLAASIAADVGYVELTAHALYARLFAQALRFPEPVGA
ncbi:MAG: ASKHA domain-containing protein [Candidatus Geothermincolia bacterium]